MKVVLLQTYDDVLDNILYLLRQINPGRADEIIATTKPDEVVGLAKEGGEMFVVTGNVFVGNWTGSRVAARVKEANPGAWVMMYSWCPESNQHLDGFIVKPARPLRLDEQSVVSILALPQEDLTPSRVKELFPQICT